MYFREIWGYAYWLKGALTIKNNWQRAFNSSTEVDGMRTGCLGRMWTEQTRVSGRVVVISTEFVLSGSAGRP